MRVDERLTELPSRDRNLAGLDPGRQAVAYGRAQQLRFPRRFREIREPGRDPTVARTRAGALFGLLLALEVPLPVPFPRGECGPAPVSCSPHSHPGRLTRPPSHSRLDSVTRRSADDRPHAGREECTMEEDRQREDERGEHPRAADRAATVEDSPHSGD